MQKQIVLIIIILVSTSMAQFSKSDPLKDFLFRCANGQIAQDYSLACQTIQRSSVLYRSGEGTEFDNFLILPSNDGIKRYLKTKNTSLRELHIPSVSVSFTQAHILLFKTEQTYVSVSGNSVNIDQVASKIIVNGAKTAILSKEEEPILGTYIFYIDNPLEFQNSKAINDSFPIPEVNYQIKGEDVRRLPIFAIVDQCAKALIFPEYSLSCQAIQNSGLLLRSQTLVTCFGIWVTLLPTNQSLESVLKEKNITPAKFVVGTSGKKFANIHLGCLPSPLDFAEVDSNNYEYVPFEKWSLFMTYSNYSFKLLDRLSNARFFSTSVGVINSKQLNGIAAQLLPSSVQSYYKSYLSCGGRCEYFLLDKPLPF